MLKLWRVSIPGFTAGALFETLEEALAEVRRLLEEGTEAVKVSTFRTSAEAYEVLPEHEWY